MGFTYKPADTPPPSATGNYAKLPQFVGKLVVVVPYEDNVPSKFKNDDGSPQLQTRATVVAVQAGSHTNPDTGDVTDWDAGEVFDVFISQAKVRRQVSEMGIPILGRLLKDGKAWVLQPPSSEDASLADTVLKDVELPERKARSGPNVIDDGTPPWQK